MGRKISYTNDGLEWEGDDKHAKSFVKTFGLGKSKGVATPGIKRDDLEEVRKDLGATDAKEYRGLLALLNLMGRDCCDLAFASMEMSKSMSNPAE